MSDMYNTVSQFTWRSDLEAEISDLKQQLSEKQAEVEDLKVDSIVATHLAAEVDELKQQLADKQAEYTVKNDQYTHLANEYDKIKRENIELRKHLIAPTGDDIFPSINFEHMFKYYQDQLKERDAMIAEARELFKQNFSEGEGEDYSPIDAFMEKTKAIGG